MRRLLATAAIVLVAAAPAAAAVGASASGSGTVLFGNTIEHISFSAQQVGAGTEATGEATIINATANVRVHVDVNCLNVIGNYAIVSGIVTQTSDPTAVPEGTQAIFAVLDAGQGRGRDFASIANFYPVGTGVDCTVPSEFDLVPVNGNFRVRPA
jgi:hypothetical protein